MMKKSYLLGAALMALTWTSCTQDDSLNLVGDDSIFTGEMEYVGSRTSLGEDNKISWVMEDELSIFKRNTINRHYKVSSINNGKATFTYLDNKTPGTVESIPANYAVYPYSEDNTITSAGVISAPIEDKYEYENRTSFISSALMASTSNGTNFSFKNVQGYLRLRLCAVIPEDYESAVKSVTLTSTKALSGTAEITFDTNGIPTANIKSDGAGQSLTVELSTPKNLSTKASGNFVELYVPVVPMTFDAREITLTINFEGGDTYSKSNGKAITITRREVTGMMLEIGADDEGFTGDIEGAEEAWDGETATVPTPVMDETTGEEYYPVVKASDLAGLAALVNGTSSTSRAAVGKINVKLTGDIDLGGHEWTPIGLNKSRFVGTFDGNGYTIKNLKISTRDNGSQAAFFGDVNKATIKNLVFDNAQILYPGSDDFYAAVVVSQAYCVTLQNITVKNSIIQGNNKVAAILAHDADGAAMIIDNCHVENSTIETKNETDGGNAGGIVGSIQGSGNEKKISNSSVKNCTFNVVNSADAGKRSNGQMVGTVIATDATKVVLENCVVKENTFNQTGVINYKSCYDGIFVGGARTEVIGQVIVNGKSYDNFVAKIGEVRYTTLQKAVDAVEDGGTITLVADETFTKNNRYNNGGWWDGLGYSGDKSFTIDLGSYTISQDGALNDYLMWFKNDGSKGNTITLKNGTLDAGKTAYCAFATASSNAQKITINTENITFINNNSNGAVLKIRGGSELNVKAGTIIEGKDSYVGIEAAGSKTVVNIYEGAKINQIGTSSSRGALIGASGNSTVNVYGGNGTSAKGGFMAMTSGGTINVSGGEWIANANGTYANDNNAVLIAQSDKQYQAGAGNSVINVTGGTFKGGYNCYGNAAGDAQINIKGGNFNANPETYLSDDCEATEANGIWTVKALLAAKIGSTEYATLQEAFNVGGEITLLRDVTIAETVVLAEGKTAVLDLNGKTITANTEDGYAINNEKGGTLTIKDTKETGNIYGVVYTENGSTTINGGTFKPVEGGKYVFLNSKGTLTINKATINGGSSYPIYSYDADNKLIINDVTVNATFGCINAYGTGGSVEINGGTYKMTGVQGKTSHIAYFSNVDATINDGTFLKNGNISMSATGGGGICAIYGAKLTIKGGEFAGDYADYYNWGGTNANNRTVAISIEGGTFKFKPTAAEGYVATQNENGTWTVSAKQ